jgi:hypothetical protein
MLLISHPHLATARENYYDNLPIYLQFTSAFLLSFSGIIEIYYHVLVTGNGFGFVIGFIDCYNSNYI